MEVEELSRSINNSKRDQEMKLENMLANDNAKVRFPNAPSSSINRLLS